MLEFDFEDSCEIKDLDLRTKLIPNDTIKLGLVAEDGHNCLAEITDVEAETFKFKLLTDSELLLGLEEEFEIIFMKETGVYKISVKLKNLIQQGSDLIFTVKTIGKAYKIQNRRYFKLNIYKRIQFTKIDKLDSKTNSQKYKGVIENINTAGIKLVTNSPLLKNDYLNLDFSFSDFSFKSIIGKVNSVIKNSTNVNSSSYYEGEIEFIWEDLSDQDELANWLNRQSYKYL